MIVSSTQVSNRSSLSMLFLARSILFAVALTMVHPFFQILLPCVHAEEIKYDDGGAEMCGSPWSSDIGSEIAVRFTPSSYPVDLQSVKFYVEGYYGKPQTPFEVRIYDDDNGDDPGTRLDQGGITAAANTGGGMGDGGCFGPEY